MAAKKDNPRWFLEPYAAYTLLESAEVEILQALALMQADPRKKTPTSPRNMLRLLSELPKSTFSFLRMQPLRVPHDVERENFINKVRSQTMHYRNLFIRDDCESTVVGILQYFDRASQQELGYSLSEQFTNAFVLCRIIEKRVFEYRDLCRRCIISQTTDEAQELIDMFCAMSPVAHKAWRVCKKHCMTTDDFRYASFQLSEICHAKPFFVKKDELRCEFGDAGLSFFERLSLRLGSLALANSEHFFLNNPIWRCPFVELDNDSLFLPLPSLFYSFPFQMIEKLTAKFPSIDKDYAQSRSRYLEDKIVQLVRSAMPSAKVYPHVMWYDEENQKEYENDVVALIGNTIFLFEAKSGRLDDAGRRGADLSLLRNFKELFVEPGQQARRLERYINNTGEGARLWLKTTGEIISLDLSNQKLFTSSAYVLNTLLHSRAPNTT